MRGLYMRVPNMLVSKYMQIDRKIEANSGRWLTAMTE